jgi:DNA-binding MarR family transcriptional regulator
MFVATQPLAFLGDMRPAFLAHLADRTNREICDQTEAIATQIGLRAPVRTFSALLFLARHGPATMADIAGIDGQSHQLVAQRLKPLEMIGLIERCDDPADARRRPYRLTSTGLVEAAQVEQLSRQLAKAMDALFAQIDCDVAAALDQTLEGLRRQSLLSRIAAAVATTRELSQCDQ